jgi:DNA-binding beta-propeller fold protein YncE
MTNGFRCLCFLLALSPLLAQRGYEVWLTDQNNTAGFSAQAPRGTHGGRIYIWQSKDLENPAGPVLNRPESIDTAVLLAAGGPNNSTGAEVSRPHMLAVSPDQKYMALAFVSSGHVSIIEAATRKIKATFRMSPGSGGARQAHAAQWTMDGNAIIIANQNGKLLERIDYDRDKDVFHHNLAATLNLATCRTPNGLPCETPTPANENDPAYWGANNRPDNAPICPIVTFNNKAIITLRGGGVLVADPTTTPMAIVAEYGNDLYGRDGCGGVQIANRIFMNSGAGSPITNISEHSLYEIADRFPDAPAFLPPNDSKVFPRIFVSHNAEMGTDHRDAHGIVAGPGGYFLYSFDRLSNEMHIHRSGDFGYIGSVPLANELSSDPTPDIAYLSPSGNHIYVALRGPRPQTGAHASEGVSPGLGIITLSEGGTWAKLTGVARTSFRNPIDGGEESDPHTVIVRLKEGDICTGEACARAGCSCSRSGKACQCAAKAAAKKKAQ